MSDDSQISALERLTKLRESGALTEEEFTAQKAAILAGGNTTASHVPFYRKLWLVVTLTCLILTFWISLIILLTGDVYTRTKDRALTPIKKSTRYVYAGFLAVWMVAAGINAVIHPSILKEDIAGGTPAQTSSGAPQAAAPSSSQASNMPDACESSDAADMVKNALENAPAAQLVSVKVLDFGKAKETWFDKASNVRRCYGIAYLNSGQTPVAYQLFFGPSGKEMVQVLTGDQATTQVMVDQAKKEEADNAAKTAPANPPAAPDATAASPSPVQQANPAPDANDALVQALNQQYIGKGYEDSEPEIEASGWKETDSDIGSQVFQKGEVKIRVEYVPTGLAQITKISRVQ